MDDAYLRGERDHAPIRLGSAGAFRHVTRNDTLGRHGLAAESVRLILQRRVWTLATTASDRKKRV